jgi:hypothetical protein
VFKMATWTLQRNFQLDKCIRRGQRGLKCREKCQLYVCEIKLSVGIETIDCYYWQNKCRPRDEELHTDEMPT